MIDNIIDIDNNDSFDFDNIKLGKPIVLQGQTFFSKVLNKQNELIIQTPKGLLKNGFVKSGKKTYCDFMISKINQNSLEWFEKIEEKIQQSIYEKSDEWFHGEKLQKDDIEEMYNSCLKSYKSGKFFTLRLYTESPRSVVKKTNIINIFDDNGNVLNETDIDNNTELICLFHIHGIKFSTKNFQLYVELKQILVTKEENNIFNKPLINTSIKTNVEKIDVNVKENEEIDINEKNNEEEILEEIKNDNDDLAIDEKFNQIINNDEETNNVSNDNIVNKEETNEEENIIKEIEYTKELSKEINNQNDNLVEYEPVINEDIEVIELEKLKINNKKKHYDEYIEAKNKAKLARKETLKLIAEAKKIKNIYMLDDLDDNDESEEENLSEEDYSENEYSENEYSENEEN